ncbi:MAG TPA: formylglycine-generating enzyme family protein, partial [Planctomycetota bacterium]|nr:formylglycine-generating enzyme family protein [Planctomycetota bacterium]
NQKFTAQQIERLHSTIPATCLSWEDCQTFCKKTGFSLPSEALWEYACRAGSTTDFCFGNSIEHLSKYAICKEDATVEKRLTNSNTMPNIGQKLPNAFGLYDMHGGIWEWKKTTTILIILGSLPMEMLLLLQKIQVLKLFVVAVSLML